MSFSKAKHADNFIIIHTAQGNYTVWLELGAKLLLTPSEKVKQIKVSWSSM